MYSHLLQAGNGSEPVTLRGHKDRERPSHSISPGTEAKRAVESRGEGKIYLFPFIWSECQDRSSLSL